MLHTELESFDPIQALEGIAEQNDWNFSNDRETDVLTIALPSDYFTYTTSMRWVEAADMLVLRITIPIHPVAPYLEYELYKLLSLVNERSVYGCWFPQLDGEETHYLVWRQEIHADSEVMSEERLENMLTNCRAACDSFFPAINAFLTAKPTLAGNREGWFVKALGLNAEETLEYLDEIRPIGYA